MAMKHLFFFILLLLVNMVPTAFSAPSPNTTPASATTPVASAAPATSSFPAVTAGQITARRQDIDTEKKTLEKLKNTIAREKDDRDNKLAQLQNETVSETMLEQARLVMESTKVNIQSTNLDLNNEKKQIQTLQTGISNLQHAIDAQKNNPKEQSRQTRLNKQLIMARSLLTLNREYSEFIAAHLGLLNEKADLDASWLQALQAVYQHQVRIRHQESLEDMKRTLLQQEKRVQTQSLQLQQKLTTLKPDDPHFASKRDFLSKQLEELKESLNILKTKITIQVMKNEYDGMDLTQLNNLPAATLQEDIKALQQMMEKLQPLITLTSDRSTVFQQQWALLQKQYALKNVSGILFTKEKTILTSLIDQLSSLLAAMKSFSAEIQQDLARVNNAYGKSVQQSLTARQSLPRDLGSWKNLLQECSTLPLVLEKIVAKSASEIQSGWFRAAPDRKLIFMVGVLLLGIFSLALGRCINGKFVHNEELNFSAKFKLVSFSLLRGSRPSILFGGTLLLAGWAFHIDSTTFHIFMLVVSIILVLQVINKFSYWIFASPLVPPAQQQPRLHHMVNWVAGFSAFFTLLVGLGNMGFFSTHLQAMIDRLFMLLLLVVVYFFLRLRTLLISFLGSEKRANFWMRLLALASFSVPLTALSAALVGLAGYVNLAWFVAGQLAIFLAVILVWIVTHDLIRELLDIWQHHLEIKVQKHNVPISLLMSPLKRIFDLLLLLTALWFLAWLYGWGTGSAVSDFLKTWLNFPLAHIGKQTITLIDLVSSIFFFLLFFYLSLLARQITYAWLYKNVNDRGLRNSLSVFTQYAILVTGVLVALNVIGINLTSLTVFAGALGVGIGFGLQNIANNLVSGLILLAERPVRVEDWVTVGDSQGVISRIGLRSLVLTTWDNQDIIIPNASLITSPVTNWTLSDNLIRTVFFVGVCYQDDPHRAKKVILEAVAMVPEVSLERKPRVFLTEFADSSVNFRVHFFSDLTDQHSRLAVKSKVMFAIWDALQDADIGIPFPQRDIYIKEMPNDNREGSPPIKEQGTGSTRMTGSEGKAENAG